jgi:rhodanese-related sulfurtransferase
MSKALSDFVEAALANITEVDPSWVLENLGNSEYTVLDVREPDEFEAGHLANAINIPRGFLEVRADLEHYKRDPRLQDRNLKLVCYCGGGHRSALAADTLRQMGFTNPLSMRGGWTEWVERGYPTEI